MDTPSPFASKATKCKRGWNFPKKRKSTENSNYYLNLFISNSINLMMKIAKKKKKELIIVHCLSPRCYSHAAKLQNCAQSHTKLSHFLHILCFPYIMCQTCRILMCIENYSTGMVHYIQILYIYYIYVYIRYVY